MVSRIEEYLNGLDKRNLVLIYLLGAMLVGFVYYMYNYSILGEEIKRYNYEIESLEKRIKDNSSLDSRVRQLEKNIKMLKSRNFFLKDEIKHLNLLVNSSIVFNVSEKRFFTILKDVLQRAIDNNIKASYKMETSVDKLKVYSIYIDGEFNKEGFFNFFNFIKDLESVRNIKKIRELSVKKEGDLIKFSLIINFWSIL